MKRFSRIGKAAAFLLAAFVGGLAGSLVLRPEAPSAGTVDLGQGNDRPAVVATFGVGGVLTYEGELWQYRPDKKEWMTLDDSFALEGQATKVVPLPVPVDRIRHMETFGFLVTKDDECWLYNIDQQRWEDVGKPPYHERTRGR